MCWGIPKTLNRTRPALPLLTDADVTAVLFLCRDDGSGGIIRGTFFTHRWGIPSGRSGTPRDEQILKKNYGPARTNVPFRPGVSYRENHAPVAVAPVPALNFTMPSPDASLRVSPSNGTRA
jgi:hypothetical protein